MAENNTQKTTNNNSIKTPLWLEITMPDGVTYRIPAKKITNKILTTDKLIALANKLTWHDVKRYATIVNRQNVDGDLWQLSPKKVIYE